MRVSLAHPDAKVVAAVDSTPVFLRGLFHILDRDGIDVLEGSGATDAVDLLGKAPDLLVLDARLLREDSSLCRRAQSDGIGVVLIVPRQQVEDLVTVVADGVIGLWDRDGDPLELKRTVDGALDGESIVSPEAGLALLARIASAGDAARAKVGRLTAREREILTLMADGGGNRAIADALYISENTVRNHVRNVLDKLQAKTRTEAVVEAIRTGLIRLS